MKIVIKFIDVVLMLANEIVIITFMIYSNIENKIHLIYLI